MMRVATVTDGAGGLGSAMVRRFVADGLRVVVADLDAAQRAPADERVTAVELDVIRPESAEAMVDEARRRLGRMGRPEDWPSSWRGWPQSAARSAPAPPMT